MEPQRPRPTRAPRNLRLWGAIGLSFGLMGPTLAMAGNGQGAVVLVGKSVPLVYIFGAIGVGLIGYGFIRLTQRYQGKGSAYSLVGMSIGPRAGLFAGLAMAASYILLTMATLGALASFVNALLADAQGSSHHPFQVSWILVALLGAALSAYLNTKDLRLVVRVLLAMEAIGILGMTVLSLVIFARKAGTPGGVDFSVFTLHHMGPSVILSAITAAVLSWAGFEACAAIATETLNPTRNIPRALFWVVVISSVLFVVVMFAQTIGFGTSKAGLADFAASPNSLTTLGHRYLGLWFSLVISFAAAMSAFSCQLSASAAASRLVASFAEDGIGPRLFTRRGYNGQPDLALWTIIGFSAAVLTACWATGRPVMGTGNPAIDVYLYFAITGVTAIIIIYFLVELGALLHVWRERPSRRYEAVAAGAGMALLAASIYYSANGQSNWLNPTNVGLGLSGVALLVTLASPHAVRRVHERQCAEDLALDQRQAGDEAALTR